MGGQAEDVQLHSWSVWCQVSKVVQARDRRQGLLHAHKQLWRPWLALLWLHSLFLSMCRQWRLVIGIRLAACKCIAGGAISLAVGVSHGGLGCSLAVEQPQRPGLAAGVVLRFQRGRMERVGETQVAGIS